MSSRLPLSSKLLDYVFHHVVLPPKVPQRQDDCVDAGDEALVDLLSNCASFFRDEGDQSHLSTWQSICRFLSDSRSIHVRGKVEKTGLKQKFSDLQVGGSLLLNIAAQNAGILIHRPSKINVDFEVFEASPRSADVLAASGPLQWDFPGSSATIPFATFDDPGFKHQLAEFLEKASCESIRQFAATTAKAGAFAYESRETTDPTLISHILISLLEANGRRTFPPITRKHVRDEICWSEGALQPWRRSPFWLVLRVGIQRYLCLLAGGVAGRVLYKFFICFALSRICDVMIQSRNNPSEPIAIIKTKLARRMAKLQVEKENAQPSEQATYIAMFHCLSTPIEQSLETATKILIQRWNAVRSRCRTLPNLRRKADDKDLVLSLENSIQKLRAIIHAPTQQQAARRVEMQCVPRPPAFLSGNIHFDHASGIEKYLLLLDFESWVEAGLPRVRTPHGNDPSICLSLSQAISSYAKEAVEFYKNDPESNSVMLLSIMELWVALDKVSIDLLPLLGDYNPGFRKGILDVLQLSRRRDLERLQAVEAYLATREARCDLKLPSIFSDPEKGCFAEKFFDQSLEMQTLHFTIGTDAHAARNRKETEYSTKRAEFERLQNEVDGLSCLFMDDEQQPLRRIHDDKRCTKCYLQRKAYRLDIEVHEWPLPDNVTESKAVVFELRCPKVFSIWRDVTWNIFRDLTRPKQLAAPLPYEYWREFAPLARYVHNNNTGLTLASMRKSFSQTHYSRPRVSRSELKDVCVPNGLKVGLFDKREHIWTGTQLRVPQSLGSFIHVPMPKDSQFASLSFEETFTPDHPGPTPNQIVASQSKCPAFLTPQEFMAFQDLRSGMTLRWIRILRELASSNINLGDEATHLLINQLALQAGPKHDTSLLRKAHWVFDEPSFCAKLLEQLEERMNGIAGSWRESQYLDTILTMLLRCRALSDSQPVVKESTRLILKVRSISLGWVGSLRPEIYNAVDADIGRRRSKDAYLAAMLCRRTFALELYNETNRLSSSALSAFIECSIVMKDNLPAPFKSLPRALRNAVLRDLRQVHRLESQLKESLAMDNEAIAAAINLVLPDPEGASTRKFTSWTFQQAPNDRWLVSKTISANNLSRKQTFHFDFIEGTLFVDGLRLGMLPDEYGKDDGFKAILGDGRFLAYPSSVPGMTYTLGSRIGGHQIHLGFRGKTLVIRARDANSTLELLPPATFYSGDPNSPPDLPYPLINDCVHWLNLSSGDVEIRSFSAIWQRKLSDWKINLQTFEAWRRQSRLVDPRSRSFHHIASVIAPFENRREMVVYQPMGKPGISVHLPRMKLSFEVKDGQLESRQLRAKIALVQDAGTLYGLESKLVLEDVSNPQLRSVLVPFPTPQEPPIITSNENQVSMNIPHKGEYGTFAINELIGRLECPAEPMLLYLKAYCHAVTSSTLPDPLTGRSGTEEALAILTSGSSQPWVPLNKGPQFLLSLIGQLTPRREWYPKDMRVLQRVFWDKNISYLSQHGNFRTLVKEILDQSELLRTFQRTMPKYELIEFSDTDLLERARSRSRVFARPIPSINVGPVALATPYETRDRNTEDEKYKNVCEVVRLIRNWNSGIPVTKDLAGKLNDTPNIKGFFEEFDINRLGDQLGLEIPSHWCQLFRICKDVQREDTYKLMFFFSLMAFGQGVDIQLLNSLICISISNDFKSVPQPPWPCYNNFRSSQVPTLSFLTKAIDSFRMPYPGDLRSIGGIQLDRKQKRQLKLEEEAHHEQVESDVEEVAKYLFSQWPCQIPTIEGFPHAVLIDIDSALNAIHTEWEKLFQNTELGKHVEQVQSRLDQYYNAEAFRPETVQIELQQFFHQVPTPHAIPTLPELLAKSAFIDAPAMDRDVEFPPETRLGLSSGTQEAFHKTSPSNPGLQFELKELHRLLNPLTASQSAVRKQYGQFLQHSLNALSNREIKAMSIGTGDSQEALRCAIQSQRTTAAHRLDRIQKSLERDVRFKWLQHDLWPRTTTATILSSLSSRAQSKFASKLKGGCIAYGVSLAALQRLLRIEAAIARETDVSDSLRPMHANWSPVEHPDWLLLEIESNISIRPSQVDVARATIAPQSLSNSVLQMNMGEGKSSCVIPMAVAVLANTKKLVRIIVPKALLLQTAQVLQSRLGGLLGRPVKHVPFSRKTSTSLETTRSFNRIHYRCLKDCGVMITEPGHVLSFKLSGLQRLSDQKHDEASAMLKTQQWLSNVCRDILDECDHVLAVKTQLIYPSGALTSVDGHPNRWKTVQAVLRLVRHHLPEIAKAFPHGIELVSRFTDGFQTACFLRKEAEDLLLNLVVQDLCRGHEVILPIQGCSDESVKRVTSFIMLEKCSREAYTSVMQVFGNNANVQKDILLLRGLFAHRILIMVLNKRWNVQYGLHPTRDPIAVPYDAKGVPAEQAEWGHPDVAILLTCLSFYYGGLQYEQFKQSLGRVLRCEDPAAEYDAIQKTSKVLPEEFRSSTGINLEDEQQTKSLWSHLGHNTGMVDQFLNHFVFPRYAKQFEKKMQASGWDIPLFAPNQGSQSNSESEGGQTGCPVAVAGPPRIESATALTTGFSGTNDNRSMLPLTIFQNDLPALSHTNAEVLTYLLQSRNRRYECTKDYEGRRLSEIDFLRKLKRKGIRVLIDSGALILEMDNLDLVKAWMKLETEVEAAVFFAADNKPTVCYRDGREKPLSASPFAENMENCVVYLDEAHTRGTDLKLPVNAIGAVTLGLGQTKDHTIQGAMRLRKLATTQSIFFFAPPEVHQSILDFKGYPDGCKIFSSDVIEWLLEQTCLGIDRLQPLYISQGLDYCRRLQASLDFPNHLVKSADREEYPRCLQQPEKFALEQLYAPKPKSKGAGQMKFTSPKLISIGSKLKQLRETYVDTGAAVEAFAHQEVEQEREVAVEIETVRAIQKPPHAVPNKHANVHKDVIRFAEEGRIVPSSMAYSHLFSVLRRTALGREFGVVDTETSSQVYATADFANAVDIKAPSNRIGDIYQRPVQWLLWSTVTETAMIISPHEAEQLLPLVRDSKAKNTHMLVYAAPVTRKMLCFNDFTFYSVPTLPTDFKAPDWLVQEIGIFSGRLYFQFEEYEALCGYLGLQTRGGVQELDGSALGSTGPRQHASRMISTTPLTFIQEWLMIRRTGQDFSFTPMGYLCQGKRISERDVFFGGTGELEIQEKEVNGDLEPDEAVGGAEDPLLYSERGDASDSGGHEDVWDDHDVE